MIGDESWDDLLKAKIAVSHYCYRNLDDYVGEDNSVRVIEAFIDALDLSELGFVGMTPAVTNRPA